ncbi:MAG: hypothetical protein ACMUIS_12060 [bacterium]
MKRRGKGELFAGKREYQERGIHLKWLKSIPAMKNSGTPIVS